MRGKADKFVEFEVPQNSNYFKSEDGILYTKDGSKLVSIPVGKTFANNTYIMPDTVTTVGKYCFNRNLNISVVVISDNLIISDNENNSNNNTLAYAIGEYTNINNFDVKDTNEHYTTGNRVALRTLEYEDRKNQGYILTKDETELVAMPYVGTGVYRMLTSGVTTIRKNAFYIYMRLGNTNTGERNFKAGNGTYSGVHFRINANTTNIEEEQFDYINFLARDNTNRSAMELEIQGENVKYEIQNDQYVEKAQ